MENLWQSESKHPRYRNKKHVVAALIGSVIPAYYIAREIQHFMMTSEYAPAILFTSLVITTLIGINSRLRQTEIQTLPLPQDPADRLPDFLNISSAKLPGFSEDISSFCWDIPMENRLN